MAWLLSLVLCWALSGAGASSSDEAINAYRAFEKRLAEVRNSLTTNPNPGSAFTSLAIERDSIDARFPFHPKEPPALTAERRKADVELRALTHKGTKSERATATKKTPPKKLRLKRK